ncbi:hypothetical protein Tco_0401188 [Tanacetum coccineum]
MRTRDGVCVCAGRKRILLYKQLKDLSIWTKTAANDLFMDDSFVASHVALVILGKEVAASKLTIFDLTKQICDAIQAKTEQEKSEEIHCLLRGGGSADKISSQLSSWASALFKNEETTVITEYLVNIRKRRAFWSLNEDILKITILTTNMPYPSRKIRRIRACTHQRPQRKEDQYAVSRKGNTPYSSYMGIKYYGRY